MPATALDREERDKAALVALACEGLGAADAAFVRRYYRHVPALDLLGRSPADVRGAALAHLQAAASRTPGTALVRVVNPDGAQGWSSPRTVVEVVTDDMPFIVDSVGAELTRQGLAIHLVVHPQLVVRRDAVGRLVEVFPAVQDQPDAVRESFVHVEVDRVTDPDRLAGLRRDLRRVLEDVRAAEEDRARTCARVQALADALEADPPAGVPRGETAETVALLRWMATGSFTFLGAREYALSGEREELAVASVPGTGLGVLRDPGLVPTEHRLADLPPDVRAQVLAPRLLTVTKANSRATVGRPAYLDYVGVKRFGADGSPVGESRFLGLLAPSVHMASALTVPVVRRKVAAVLEASGFEPGGHDWNELLQVLQTHPRDELLQADVAELARTALGILHLQDRRRVALFARRDPFGRYVSCLVFLPRDRFSTDVRLAMQAVLVEAYDGASVEYTTRLTESVLARLHVVVRARGSAPTDLDEEGVRGRLERATRTWDDELADSARRQLGEARADDLLRRWGDAFPEAYKEDAPPRIGVLDLDRLDRLGGGLGTALYHPHGAPPHERRFKLFRRDGALSLSDVMPLLQAMGLEVTDERPYGLRSPDGGCAWVYDFGVRRRDGVSTEPDAGARERFESAVAAVWRGDSESDPLNALVLAADLPWRSVAVLRAYSRYLRQTGSAFSQDYVAATLVGHPGVARMLVQLFAVRFDPAFDGDRGAEAATLVRAVESALDDVTSLDEDRILRTLLGLVRATLRTNAYRRDDASATDVAGEPRATLALKLDPHAVPELPAPRPAFEVWVCSPRVEGVHLRFGHVARGGLRWSDRRADFRTEVLGLVRAQTVKNTVIVPTGAKGGFVVKRPPADPGDRDAVQAEGVACYRGFVSALLDVTDDLRDGAVVPPPDVVRHDGDDAYLVVAADKGTATFSDVANEIAVARGFWLGDAFASGGSAGYDHKRMGITARGAWESVTRHFRGLGLDVATQPFTAVGIGDMSGDVFGNAMLLSPALRLVAAFDHRHVFLDPDPDPVRGLAERRRLAALARSSWDDYDRSAVSPGGGVWPRSAKVVPLGPEAVRALGLAEGTREATPAELVRAVLLAPVDLLFNGGIGTYVKARHESHADVGDRANDAVRVDGRELRCRVVGEGGNLGLTQAGRVEYALAGGRVYTDAVDNSAGVDTSDHEVNIKVLLNGAVDAGLLPRAERDPLLAAMTDDVARLVLRDNVEQTLALELAAGQAPGMLDVHARCAVALGARAGLDRALERLPGDDELAARRARGEGLTRPELAVLLAYTKIWLTDAVLRSDAPEDPWLRGELAAYFPQRLRSYAAPLQQHRLRREIVATRLVNRAVNLGGITLAHRLVEETGAAAADVVRAWTASVAVVGAEELVAAVEELGPRVDAVTQARALLAVRLLVERVTRWLLQHRRCPLDVGAAVAGLRDGVGEVLGALPAAVTGHDAERVDAERAELAAAGLPAGLAGRMAALPLAAAAPGVVDVAAGAGRPVSEALAVWLALDEGIGLWRLREHVLALPRASRWEALARAALRDDLQTAHAALAAGVLAATPPGPAPARVSDWREANGTAVQRAAVLLGEVAGAPAQDLATVSVALRHVRALVAAAT